MAERNTNDPQAAGLTNPRPPSPPSTPPQPLRPAILDLRDPDGEPLGGEPPCMAPLLDEEGRLPDRPPTR